MDACLERGLLVGSAGERVLRLDAAADDRRAELDQALDVLGEVLA